MSFDGRVALVSGAGGGMGRLAAQNLARAGARVAALDINEAGLEETRAGMQGIHSFPCDVCDAQAVERNVRAAEDRLGTIDRVYNAAGIMPTGQLMEQPTALIHKIMQVNYFGTVNVTKSALPGMLQRKRGDLINFASLAGFMPSPSLGAYDASKFAVVAFSEVLFHENRGRGVRMTCVCPPAVKTPLFEQATPPKTFQMAWKLEPQQVLDAIETSLDAGEIWCLPGPGTNMVYHLRRLIPNTLWRFIHLIERYG